MAESTWNLNRLLVVLGGAAGLGALVAINGGDLASAFSMEFAPFFLGPIAAILLAIWARPWFYLVAGVLVALFPLAVVLVFGAFAVLARPVAAGGEAQGVLLMVLSALLALTGGIAGFVQGRRGTQTPMRASFRAPQGALSIVVGSLLIGAFVMASLATADARELGASPAGYIEGARHVEVRLVEFKFEPKEIRVPAGELVMLDLVNDDPVAHTFSYHFAGALRETVVPGKTTVGVPLRFETAQTIHVWCAPHSGGADDRDDTSMWATLSVG